MKIYIPGAYTTKFGELWERDLLSLGVEAAMGAMSESEIDAKDIDAVYVGNMCASKFCGQDHLGALFADELRIRNPAFHIEAACASGSLAFRSAWLDILSGQSKNILVIGVEKMSDVDVADASKGLSGASSEEWEAYVGITFPSLYAMIAREHMRKFTTTREQMAMCAVQNHKHGSLNSKAQFQNQITIDQVLNASMVADPLGLFDCSPLSDGASAVVLSSKKKSDVSVRACAQAQDTFALHNRKDLTTLQATVEASRKAFKQAKIKHKDIDMVEVHDCFTIAQIVALEDLGFAKKGEGGKFVESGITELHGKLPTNTSGGLKAAGHPVGATGIKQIVEIVEQMRGKCGKRQIEKEVKYGLAHNVGGSGATAVVSILERM